MDFKSSMVEVTQILAQLFGIVISFITLKNTVTEARTRKYKYVYRERPALLITTVRSLILVAFGFCGALILAILIVDFSIGDALKEIILGMKYVLELCVLMLILIMLICFFITFWKIKSAEFGVEFSEKNAKERKKISGIVSTTLDKMYFTYVIGILISEILTKSIGDNYTNFSVQAEYYLIVIMFVLSMMCLSNLYIDVHITTIYLPLCDNGKLSKIIKGIIIKKERDVIFIKNIESKVIYEVDIKKVCHIKHEKLLLDNRC